MDVQGANSKVAEEHPLFAHECVNQLGLPVGGER